jgi:transposase
MSKTLSVDLRERVVAAVGAGASCRVARGARSGLGSVRQARSAGAAWHGRADRLRRDHLEAIGDRRSALIEAHAALILGLIEQRSDITLAEIQAELAKVGVPAGIGTIWRFFDRHRITRKKRPGTPPSRIVPTS